MNDASYVWWLVPSMALAGMILGVVYVIREDPMFGQMLPFMDPSSAWTVAGYYRLSEIQRKKDNGEPVSNEEAILWGVFGGIGGFMALSKGGRFAFQRLTKFKPLDYAETLKVWDEAARLKAKTRDGTPPDPEDWEKNYEDQRTRIRKNVKDLVAEQGAKEALKARTNEIRGITEAMEAATAREDDNAVKALKAKLEERTKAEKGSSEGRDWLTEKAGDIPRE